MSAESKASVQMKKPDARKCSGQPGSANAVKHGFSTSSFSLTERRGLQTARGLVLAEMTGQETRKEA
jgi:hypothetical protein